MVSMLIGVLVKIPISYILIANPNYGIAGAPIGTIVGYAASMLFSCFCCRSCGISIAVLKSYLRPFLNSVLSVFCILILLCIREQNSHHFGHNFFVLFLFGIFYLLFSYLFGVLRIGKITEMTNQTKNATLYYKS